MRSLSKNDFHSFKIFSIVLLLASLDSIIQPKIPFEFRKGFISGNMLKTSGLKLMAIANYTKKINGV
jgi:hypothetical protein